MPRYFIDSDDGELEARDEEGQDFASPNAARNAALKGLPDMAHDEIPDGEQRTFTVTVRNDVGREIYQGTLTFKGRWIE